MLGRFHRANILRDEYMQTMLTNWTSVYFVAQVARQVLVDDEPKTECQILLTNMHSALIRSYWVDDEATPTHFTIHSTCNEERANAMIRIYSL